MWKFVFVMAGGAALFALFAGLTFAMIAISRYRRRAQVEVHESRRQLEEVVSFFTDFSKSFREYDDPANTLTSMSRYIADLIGAKSVCIYEMHYNFLLAAGVWGNYPLVRHRDPAGENNPQRLLALLRREKIRIGEGFVGEVAAARSDELVPEALRDDRFRVFADYGRIGSVMAVPMVSDQRLYGMLVAAGSVGEEPFSRDQLQRLHFISAQVIMVQTLLGIYADRSRQQRLNQELEFARQLQSSMLPQSLPHLDQFEVQAYTGSAKEVNGDFYDFVEIDDDRMLIVIGDACGKGVPACMLTSMTRSFIRSAADHFTNLEDFLREINRNLYRDTDEERYVTLGCCLLNRRNGIVEYARAGHTDLFLYALNHMRTFYPDGAGLGVLPNEFAAFDTISFELRRGSTMMMFSDGLSEALNEDNEEFGVERLKQVFADSCHDRDTLEMTVNRVLEAVRRFSSDQADDQTMILVRRR
ncbi:MAG: SpoIIE family protein phosphatase [Victivallaceae bacterium]|nr:SpoIIE family protein phosphatase [Victivallaceae bacterium]